MNSYLDRLSTLIKKELPREEFEDVMQYYTEYFADAGVENEAKVCKELGTPEELADKILMEYKGKFPECIEPQAKRKGLSAGWIAFIAVVGSPLWFALFIVAIVLFAVLIALVAVFAAMGIAGAFGGFAMIIVGIIMFFQEASLGMLMIGYGFVLVGCGCAFVMLLVLMIQLIKKIIRFIKRKVRSRKAAKVEVTE